MGQKHAASSRSVAVLGGGLAGLSAGRRLAELGFRVTLVEARRFLGGRAFSFYDDQVEWEIDNGQHVFMGCCSYYVDFLAWAGTLDSAYLQRRLRTEVVLDGRSGVISSTPWLGPLHLLPSFLLYPHLSFTEKLKAAYALIRMKLADRRRLKEQLDAETAYGWLRRHGQSERAIANLWNLIILPMLNDDVRDVSADMALMVFQEGLLKTARFAAIGFSRVGLTSLAGTPAQSNLEDAGNEVMLGRPVRAVRIEGGKVAGVDVAGGPSIEADVYVSALPFDALLRVLPEEVAASEFFSAAAGLSFAPIVGIHLWYDRKVMDQDFVVFLDSPVQFVFNKTAIQDDSGYPGQYLCISLSGAWKFAGMTKDELRDLFSKEMERLLPRARGASIEWFLVVKQQQATFRPVPGSAAHRLPHRTPIENLYLAGDWTDVGWPSTMEGAVRSGVFAADLAAQSGQAKN